MPVKTKRQKTVLAALIVPAALWTLILGGCKNPIQNQDTEPNTPPPVSSAPAITSFSVAGVSGEINAAAKTINAAVPWFEGIDPAALAVEIKIAEGASITPVFSGTGDFSKSQIITVRDADGNTDRYKVSVYVLFEGEEGLKQLYDYASMERGVHTADNPLYIALTGLEFKRYTETINGRASAYLADHISYYLREQHAALDLSRCTGSSIASTGINSHAAFYRVTSIILPATVRVINPAGRENTGLFYYGVLTTVEFPPDLKEIGGGAFGYCTSLKSVEFPPALKTIGYEAFWHSGLEEVQFNQGLESISSFAFSSTRLKTLVLPSSVTTVGNSAFSRTPLETADLSATKITVAETWIFNECGRLKEIKLPNTIEDVKTRALAEIPAVKTIDLSACSIYETLAEFRNDTSLETLIFPKTLEFWQIKAYDLKSPNSETFDSFYGCDSLKTLVFKSPSPPELYILGSDVGSAFERLPPDFAIYVPDSGMNAYKGAKNFSRYADHIKPLSALR
jgi:hypothetical protein